MFRFQMQSLAKPITLSVDLETNTFQLTQTVLQLLLKQMETELEMGLLCIGKVRIKMLIKTTTFEKSILLN